MDIFLMKRLEEARPHSNAIAITILIFCTPRPANIVRNVVIVLCYLLKRVYSVPGCKFEARLRNVDFISTPRTQHSGTHAKPLGKDYL